MIHGKRCKVCTVDMDSARNIEFMCSMCCTSQWNKFVMVMSTLWIWYASWTCKDATWNYVTICMNMRIIGNAGAWHMMINCMLHSEYDAEYYLKYLLETCINSMVIKKW